MASGILEKFFALFTASNDPEAANRRRIKQLAKELSHNKYSKFYHARTGEIDGSLGKLFFDIYKIVSHAQVLLQNASKSTQLQQIVTETFFPKDIDEVRKRLTPEAIEEKAKAGLKELTKSLNSDFTLLSSVFDSGLVANIDRCYNTILAMGRMVSFDLYPILKKFDSKITERNFSYQPKFMPVRGEYLTNDLKDFLDVSFGLDPDQDWKKALAALKTYKNGIDIVAADQWNKLLLLLRDIKRSGIIELMIRHIEEKPDMVFKSKLSDEHIAETYLENKKTEIKAAIAKVVSAKKNAQIDALVKTVFGNAAENRTKFYTEKAGEIYVKKNFDGFLYAGALNYLKAFMLDYLKKDIRTLFDLLLIRGQWTDQVLSMQTSEHFNRLMEISDELIVFDESMADGGENGSRLKASIVKADRDKSQARYVTLILKTVNEQALEILKESALAFIALGKGLKLLSDDLRKPKHELVMNWKDIESLSEIPLDKQISDAYKKIYYFVQLLQAFTAHAPGENG